ncbi:MAG: long-chain fatty acid--CoA ligase [Bacteroidales bacterium]|nr:long-chain fatty acid--CoA ligase [Bacteroidales bacterium]
MSISRTFDLLDRFQQQFNKEDVFNAKSKGKWISYSTQEYVSLSYEFAYGLMSLGYQKGDKLATITNNRPEWNFMDIGMAMLGVVHVPMFTSLSQEDYTYTLDHSDAKAVVVSDKSLLKKISPALEKLNALQAHYTIEQIEDEPNWMDIVELGRQKKDEYKDQLEKIKKDISPEDCATLIYTSGTTGLSKGVMLSHKNLVENFIAASKVFAMGPNDRYLSILPLCHVGGRMGNYQSQYSGSSIFYAENMGTIAANMKEIQADGFDTVPRILEKIFDSVIAKGNKLSGMKKKIFFWAVKLGLRYKLEEDNSWLYNRKLKIADKLIFSKWREALGGKIRLSGCGGASLQPRLERVFWAAGIKIINMYGLTETSPIITINRQEKPDLKLGSVGSLIDGVELKIANDGEILCRGHNVMLGYYKDTEQTKSAIDEEGWFHTGDIGRLDDGKYLMVTDRKKEIFKLSNGKFIAPQVLEGRLKESALIDQSCVVGEAEKFASALISPNMPLLEKQIQMQNITFENREDMVKSKPANDIIKEEIRKINKSLGQIEQVVRFILVHDEWSPESGELSPTLKLRRKFIHTKYQNQIQQVYQK